MWPSSLNNEESSLLFGMEFYSWTLLSTEETLGPWGSCYGLHGSYVLVLRQKATGYGRVGSHPLCFRAREVTSYISDHGRSHGLPFTGISETISI